MNPCCGCTKEYPESELTVQITIFFEEEYYCEECWDKLIEE
jgi:hypothetical protein